MSLKKKIELLREKQERLLNELDTVSHDIKRKHIEYLYLCNVRDLLRKTKN